MVVPAHVEGLVYERGRNAAQLAVDAHDFVEWLCVPRFVVVLELENNVEQHFLGQTAKRGLAVGGRRGSGSILRAQLSESVGSVMGLTAKYG
jgi:hypothetical protein